MKPSSWLILTMYNMCLNRGGVPLFVTLQSFFLVHERGFNLRNSERFGSSETQSDEPIVLIRKSIKDCINMFFICQGRTDCAKGFNNLLDLDQIFIDWSLFLDVPKLNAKFLDSRFHFMKKNRFSEWPKFHATNNANAKLIVHRFQKPRFKKVILLFEIFICKIDKIFRLIFFGEKLRGNRVTPSDMLFQVISFNCWFSKLHPGEEVIFHELAGNC